MVLSDVVDEYLTIDKARRVYGVVIEAIDREVLAYPWTSLPSSKMRYIVRMDHSRPHTSNDNAYSESQFKTLKYRPDFPRQFGSKEHARAFCQGFFEWYNKVHRHWGIGLLTPQMVLRTSR